MIKAAVNTFEDTTAVALIPQIWQVIYKDADTNIIELPITPITKIIDISMINFDNRVKKINNSIGSFNNLLFFNPLPTSQLLIIEFLADLESPNNFISENIKLSL
ncbi:MAG: hypothetical protein MRQ07_05235 [Candidatus Midichloria sp.]|nr:hypothetical protein [Candidatus Midichloria sp.]